MANSPNVFGGASRNVFWDAGGLGHQSLSYYWCLNVCLCEQPGWKSPGWVQISEECGSFVIPFSFHFSTISRECFICIIKEQCERKPVTVFQGQAHFCQPDYVRNEGHFHGDNSLTLSMAVTIITFRQDLGNNLEGSCERSNKLTWILKIQLDTSLWLCLHSCWNVCSIKRFQLSSAKRGRICVLPNALSQA